MNITPLALGIFMLVAVLITFVVVPLLGTTLLWLTSKLWRFGDRTFKSSFKAFLVVLGVMLAMVWVTQILFVKDFGQLAQSSPQSFVWFLLACFVLGTIVGIIAIKKFFQESLAKSIGAAITFSVFSGISFFIIITIITVAIVFFKGPASFQNNEQLNKTEISSQTPSSSATMTIKSGGAIGFTLEKSPADAVRWLLQVKCPNGVGGLVVPVVDGKAVAEEIIQCNNEKTLLQSPITFQAKFTNLTYGDKTATILSKTFDSMGKFLNEETLSVTVKGNIDAVIEATVSNARVVAEIYFDGNGESYAGVCASTKSIPNYKNVSATYNELQSLSGSVVCKDSQTAWAMSAQLKDNPSKYFCVDTTGATIERSSAITTTSCK